MKSEKGNNNSWHSVETSQRYLEAISSFEQREIKITKEQYHEPVFSNEAKLQEFEHLRKYRDYPLYLLVSASK